jgi:arginase family enzyme
MRVRLFDLDGSVTSQPELLHRCGRAVHDLRRWGPRIRLSCRFRSFYRFQAALEKALAREPATTPYVTFYGSGDFHHVSFALARRIRTPFNLLVLDNHPDWMRGVPVLHCGTWLHHAAQLPQVRRIFHVGGDVDFDNAYRWLAPWPQLAAGKIRVIPALRRYTKGKWAGIRHEPLRPDRQTQAVSHRVLKLLRNDLEDLARWPLYISLDKDVLSAADAVVNWDSGLLRTQEVEAVLQGFITASHGNLVGMDVTGDWSPVNVRGIYRRWLDRMEHPVLRVDSWAAARRNEDLNLRLLAFVLERASVRRLASEQTTVA